MVAQSQRTHHFEIKCESRAGMKNNFIEYVTQVVQRSGEFRNSHFAIIDAITHILGDNLQLSVLNGGTR